MECGRVPRSRQQCQGCLKWFADSKRFHRHSCIQAENNNYSAQISSCKVACQHCKEQFRTKLQLSRHSCNHSEEKVEGDILNCKYKCQKCHEQFRTKLQLIRHSCNDSEKKVELSSCIHECKHCKEQFQNKIKLTRHSCSKSKKENESEDSRCKPKLKQSKTLQLRNPSQQSNHPSTGSYSKKKKKISVCNETEPQSEIQSSKLEKNPIPSPKHKHIAIKCKGCNIGLTSNYQLSQHSCIKTEVIPRCKQCQDMLSSDEGLPRPGSCSKPAGGGEVGRVRRSRFQCRECKNWFSDILRLARHSCIYHTTVDNPPVKGYHCQRSQHQVTGKLLDQHVCEHSGDLLRDGGTHATSDKTLDKSAQAYKQEVTDDESLEEPEWEEESSSDSDFDVHSTAHQQKWQHKCQLCDRTYLYKKHLLIHLKRQHMEEDKYPHKCPHCHKGYYSEKSLETHIQAQHQERVNECPQCQIVFRSKIEFQRHKQSHGEMEATLWPCHVCGKQMTKASLRRHQLIHGDKTHGCEFCGKMFQTKRSLDKHIVRHDTNDQYLPKVKELLDSPVEALVEDRVEKLVEGQVEELIEVLDNKNSLQVLADGQLTVSEEIVLDDHVARENIKLEGGIKQERPLDITLIAEGIVLGSDERENTDGDSIIEENVVRESDEKEKSVIVDTINRQTRDFDNAIDKREVLDCSDRVKVVLESEVWEKRTIDSKTRLQGDDGKDEESVLERDKITASDARNKLARNYNRQENSLLMKGETIPVEVKIIESGSDPHSANHDMEANAVKEDAKIVTVMGEVGNCMSENSLCKSSANNGVIREDTDKMTTTIGVTKDHWCRQCGDQFDRELDFMRHTLTQHHRNIDWDIIRGGACLKYRCRVCQRVCSDKTDITRHAFSHTDVRNYQCPTCHKSFARKVILENHLVIHTGEKRFQCLECFRQFTHHSHYSEHLLTHSGVKKYPCPHCDQRFTRKAYLNRHSVVHTNIKRHRCLECNRMFRYASSLREHTLQHTGYKFHCKECGQSFARRSGLRRHLQTHATTLDFQCHICGVVFTQATHLTSHIKEHVKEEARSEKHRLKILRKQRKINIKNRNGPKPKQGDEALKKEEARREKKRLLMMEKGGNDDARTLKRHKPKQDNTENDPNTAKKNQKQTQKKPKQTQKKQKQTQGESPVKGKKRRRTEDGEKENGRKFRKTTIKSVEKFTHKSTGNEEKVEALAELVASECVVSLSEDTDESDLLVEYICPHCNKAFNQLSLLSQHLPSHNNVTAPSSCQELLECFSDRFRFLGAPQNTTSSPSKTNFTVKYKQPSNYWEDETCPLGRGKQSEEYYESIELFSDQNQEKIEPEDQQSTDITCTSWRFVDHPVEKINIEPPVGKKLVGCPAKNKVVKLSPEKSSSSDVNKIRGSTNRHNQKVTSKILHSTIQCQPSDSSNTDHSTHQSDENIIFISQPSSSDQPSQSLVHKSQSSPNRSSENIVMRAGHSKNVTPTLCADIQGELCAEIVIVVNSGDVE